MRLELLLAQQLALGFCLRLLELSDKEQKAYSNNKEKPQFKSLPRCCACTKEINTASNLGNRLKEVDLGYDLCNSTTQEKGLTGNNLELEQSNLLKKYTLDRLDAVNDGRRARRLK